MTACFPSNHLFNKHKLAHVTRCALCVPFMPSHMWVLSPHTEALACLSSHTEALACLNSSPLQGSWCERLLKSMYYVTQRHGPAFPFEIERLWSTLAASKRNIIPILDFLTSLGVYAALQVCVCVYVCVCVTCLCMYGYHHNLIMHLSVSDLYFLLRCDCGRCMSGAYCSPGLVLASRFCVCFMHGKSPVIRCVLGFLWVLGQFVQVLLSSSL